MTPATRRSLLLLLLACLLVPLPLVAQDDGETIFIDRVDVNVVNVEVFVTDRDGNRVADLTADDFEIYEDGRLVEVSNFYSAVRESRQAWQIVKSKMKSFEKLAAARAAKSDQQQNQRLASQLEDAWLARNFSRFR